MFTPHWAGVVGSMVFSRQGSGFQSYSLLGVRIGCMSLGSGFTLVTTHWVIDNIKEVKIIKVRQMKVKKNNNKQTWV